MGELLGPLEVVATLNDMGTSGSSFPFTFDELDEVGWCDVAGKAKAQLQAFADIMARFVTFAAPERTSGPDSNVWIGSITPYEVERFLASELVDCKVENIDMTISEQRLEALVVAKHHGRVVREGRARDLGAAIVAKFGASLGLAHADIFSMAAVDATTAEHSGRRRRGRRRFPHTGGGP